MYYSVISLANVLFSSPYIVFDHLNVLRFVIQGSVIITYTNVIFLSMQGDSYVTIVRKRYGGRCSESITGSPAGYSYLSANCVKGCARNYCCKFGTYSALSNNCHRFANSLSEVLCTSGHTCHSWCLGSCNNAKVI